MIKNPPISELQHPSSRAKCHSTPDLEPILALDLAKNWRTQPQKRRDKFSVSCKSSEGDLYAIRQLDKLLDDTVVVRSNSWKSTAQRYRRPEWIRGIILVQSRITALFYRPEVCQTSSKHFFAFSDVYCKQLPSLDLSAPCSPVSNCLLQRSNKGKRIAAVRPMHSKLCNKSFISSSKAHGRRISKPGKAQPRTTCVASEPHAFVLLMIVSRAYVWVMASRHLPCWRLKSCIVDLQHSRGPTRTTR